MKALNEEKETEDGCYSEARREKPARLAQRVGQEYRQKHRNRPEKRDSIVGPGEDEAGDFELPQGEGGERGEPVEANESPEPTDCGEVGEKFA